MDYQTATSNALEAGATLDEIMQSADRQGRNVGSIPFNNMIKALHIGPWHNTKDDWIRLAGALIARNLKRSKK